MCAFDLMFWSRYLGATFRGPFHKTLHSTLLNSSVNKYTSREISDSTFSLRLECGVRVQSFVERALPPQQPDSWIL